MTRYTNSAGWDFIDPSTVEAEYFAGSVPCDRTDPDCDFGHIVMTDRLGLVWFARDMLKGENVDDVIARLKHNGAIDTHCALMGKTEKGIAKERAYLREMSMGS